MVANALGDPTARRMGRLTLNPLPHIDWIGLIMLVVAGFGWAKPVMVDPRNFRNPRTDFLWVALAGPATNVLVALVALVISLHASLPLQSAGYTVLSEIFRLNVLFAVFNILPIPPLDGSKIISAFGGEAEYLVRRMEPFGWVVLLALVYFHFIDRLLLGMGNWLAHVLYAIAIHLGAV